MGEEIGVHRGVGGEARGKEAIWRPRRRLEDNINMDVQEIGLDRVGSG
jgi:hypothetical protein